MIALLLPIVCQGQAQTVKTVVKTPAISVAKPTAKPIAKVTVTPIRTIADAQVIALAPAPKGSLIAASTIASTIRIYDAKTGKLVKELTGHPQWVYALAWSPDGKYLASGDESARIFVWDTSTWTVARQYRSHQKGIQDLNFNAASTLLVSTGKDDILKLWDLRTGMKSPAKDFPGKGSMFGGAKFIGNSDNIGVGILAYGAREYSIYGNVTGFFPLKEQVQDVDYRSDGKLMAAASREGVVTVWNTPRRTRLATLKGHEGFVSHVRFSPNGQFIASSSEDRTVRIWDASTYQQVCSMPGASFGSPLAWTADGKYLASVNLGEVLQISSVTPPQNTMPLAPGKMTKVAKKGATKRSKKH